jgi:hypothetical protein
VCKENGIKTEERRLQDTQGAAQFGPNLNGGLELKREGRFSRPLTITQVINDHEAIAQVPVGNPERNRTQLCLLRGVATKGWVGDQKVNLSGKHTITSTFTYQSALGTQETILVVEPSK